MSEDSSKPSEKEQTSQSQNSGVKDRNEQTNDDGEALDQATYKSSDEILKKRLDRAKEFIKRRGWSEDGFVAKYIMLNAMKSDIPFEVSEAFAFVLLGYALGYNTVINFETPTHMNFFILVAGASFRTRKTTAQSILESLQFTAMLNEGTPQAILDQLYEMLREEVEDEDGDTEVVYDQERVASAILIQDEFQRFLKNVKQKSYLYAADGFYNRMYDCRPIGDGTRGFGPEKRVRKPYVSCIFALTVDALKESIPQDLIGSGFFNRLLIIYPTGVREPKVKASPYTQKLVEELQQILWAIFSKNGFTIDYDESAYLKYFHILNQFKKENELEHNAFERAETHWEKVSAIYLFDRLISEWSRQIGSSALSSKSLPSRVTLEEDDFRKGLEYIEPLLLKEKELLPYIEMDIMLARLKTYLESCKDKGVRVLPVSKILKNTHGFTKNTLTEKLETATAMGYCRVYIEDGRPMVEILDEVADEPKSRQDQRDHVGAEIIHGDCLEELPKLDDNSVDLVITDPPYWDKVHYSDDVRDIGRKQPYEDYILQRAYPYA